MQKKSSPQTDSLNNIPLGLTYDDVLLLPGYSDFKREEVDTTVTIGKNVSLSLPVISSPMDTVTETEMAKAMALNGGLGIIHRNLKPDAQADMVAAVKKTPQSVYKSHSTLGTGKKLAVGAAVGTGSDLEKRVEFLMKAGVDIVVVDSGHGYTKFIIDAISKIKNIIGRTTISIMAGNVATEEGTAALINAGADIIRVGMGPGSICTTRVVTGMGVPQLTAIESAVKAARKRSIPVIADGGIKQIGDIAKALAAGARCVMLGSMLAGFSQSPGEVTTINNIAYKQYRGMGSIAAMKKGGAERYGQDRATERSKLIAEGVESLVKYKGNIDDFLFQIAGGLRSSFYYIGGSTYEEFVSKAKFIRVTQSSLVENHPHDVMVIDAGSSYM